MESLLTLSTLVLRSKNEDVRSREKEYRVTLDITCNLTFVELFVKSEFCDE